MRPEAPRDPELERRHWEAIAGGFGLSVPRARRTLWPVFWRRAVVRVGVVALCRFDEDGDPVVDAQGRSYDVYSRTPKPAWPWVVRDVHHLALMLGAACAAQGDPTPPRGDWRWALERCERTLDAAIDHWLAGMSDENAALIRGELGCWAHAPVDDVVDVLRFGRARAEDEAMLLHGDEWVAGTGEITHAA